MSRRVKQLMLDELAQEYGDVQETGCVVVDYRGLAAQEAVDLRQSLKEQNADFRVVKNRVMVRVLEQNGVEEGEELFNGPCAVITAEDPVTTAKATTEAIKQLGKMEVRGAFVQGRVLGVEEVEALAKLPSLDELRAQIMGIVNSPMVKIATVINAVPQKLVGTIGAVRDQMKEEAEESA